MKYIHYGDSSYDRKLLEHVGLRDLYSDSFKPYGLWASPVNAERSWNNWCRSNDFLLDTLDKSFQFKLSADAKILHIDTMEVGKKYLIAFDKYRDKVYYRLDLKTLYEKYDGVELHFSNDAVNFHRSNCFNVWDVDSICIWNPNVVIPE